MYSRDFRVIDVNIVVVIVHTYVYIMSTFGRSSDDDDDARSTQYSFHLVYIYTNITRIHTRARAFLWGLRAYDIYIYIYLTGKQKYNVYHHKIRARVATAACRIIIIGIRRDDLHGTRAVRCRVINDDRV